MVVDLNKVKKLEEELKKSKESAKLLSKDFQNEFKRQLLTLVTAAFGFTAALFWNEAIKNTIKHFIPQAESWYWEIGIAILVTVIAVFFIYFLARISKPKEEVK
ncbi:MAG: DUF5654 family protein [Candidatus Micrarchaeota archaeon]